MTPDLVSLLCCEVEHDLNWHMLCGELAVETIFEEEFGDVFFCDQCHMPIPRQHMLEFFSWVDESTIKVVQKRTGKNR